MNPQSAVQDAITEATAEELIKVDQGDFMLLQKAASEFLARINEVSDFYEAAIHKTKIKSKITQIYKDMRDESAYTQKILKEAHEFEKAWDTFLGRTVYLTYVNKDGSMLFYDDANIGKLYSMATANKGRGNISASKIFDANDLEDSVNAAIQSSVHRREQVYRKTLERYDKNKNETYMNYNISKKTFYWWAEYHQVLGGWTRPISNRGTITEAYANAVINEDEQIVNTNIENSIKRLWKTMGKDSIGAAIKGDIVYNKDGNIQFAVKGGSFSTAKVGQYVNLAYNITQLKNLTVEDLNKDSTMKKLMRLTKATDAVVADLNERAEEALLAEIPKNISVKI